MGASNPALPQESAPRSGRRLAYLIRSSVRLAWQADRRLLILTAGLQLTNGLIMAAQILIIKQVLDAIIKSQQPGGSITDTVLPVAFLAVAIAATSVSSAVQTHWQRLLGELVSRTTWNDILDVTSSVSLREYESPAFYDQLQRVQTNALGRPYMLTQALVGLIGSLTGAIGLSVAVIAINPLLFLLLLVSGVPLYLATRQGGRLEFAFAVAQSPRVRLRVYLSQLQTGRDEAKEVRAFGIAAALRARYNTVYDTYLAALRHHIKRRSVISLASSIASALVLAGTMFVIIWLVADHNLSLASAGAAIVAVRMLAGQITGIFSNISQIFEAGLFLDDLSDFLAKHPIAHAEERSGSDAPHSFDRLDVDQLSFTYPGTDKAVLHGIDLEISRGEVVALVGENGSGKTTLAKLLAALYRPDGGRICWDGIDIASYDREGVRQAIAVIFQDFVRYQLSARDNIGFGRSGADQDESELVRAAERSGAARFIERLPENYETILSKAFGGQDLSGGQWQRIALARAFYRNAPFVILDEPSAALDPRAEHELFNSLRELLAGRTVLFISHRMSTVRDADRIYVMAEGRIVEVGTHDELMQLGGQYAELFTLQAKAFN